jgi:hypothetical protein
VLASIELPQLLSRCTFWYSFFIHSIFYSQYLFTTTGCELQKPPRIWGTLSGRPDPLNIYVVYGWLKPPWGWRDQAADRHGAGRRSCLRIAVDCSCSSPLLLEVDAARRTARGARADARTPSRVPRQESALVAGPDHKMRLCVSTHRLTVFTSAKDKGCMRTTHA